MNDIQNNQDLYFLVDEFYKKLLSDNRINYIFTDIVKIKIDEHLPILVTFWSQVIFGTGGYIKNLTNIHVEIDKKASLTSELFKIWLIHFDTTVNENFKGEKSEKIKTTALNLATVMRIKLQKQ